MDTTNNDLQQRLAPHAGAYANAAHAEYSDEELRWWVHLLRKRATHRTDATKAEKDRYDADNYQAMLDARA